MNVFLLTHFGKIFRRLTSTSVSLLRVKRYIGYITCTNGTSSSFRVYSCEAARKEGSDTPRIDLDLRVGGSSGAGEKSAPTLIESTYLFDSKSILLRIRRGRSVRARVKGKRDVFALMHFEGESLVVLYPRGIDTVASLRLEHETYQKQNSNLFISRRAWKIIPFAINSNRHLGSKSSSRNINAQSWNQRVQNVPTSLSFKCN